MASATDDDWLEPDDDIIPTASGAVSDIDRSFDRRDFLRLRLKIFKDEYRETAYESEEASAQHGFDDAFRRCIGFCRQLGRAKGALKALKSRNKETIDRLLGDIDSCLTQIRTVQTTFGKPTKDRLKDAGEFDMEFASRALSQYDPEDMEMFLGEDQQRDAEGDQGGDIMDVQVGKSDFELALNDLEVKAELILAQVCDILHSFGRCDGFIYA